MLAMIPSSSTTHGGWIPGNPQSTNGRSSELFIQFSSPQPSHHVKVESCSPPSAGDGRHRGGGGCGGDDPVAVAKKLKHNASERDRRKKMNSLYTSLRCLLPSTNRTVGFASSSGMNVLICFSNLDINSNRFVISHVGKVLL